MAFGNLEYRTVNLVIVAVTLILLSIVGCNAYAHKLRANLIASGYCEYSINNTTFSEWRKCEAAK